jgi:DNA-binding response OmpR family regulator
MPKVLVADDSITVRKVAERLLIEAGMEVALAASGEEAMAYLSTERPDFVISDVIMPDKSGYDVCRFVRSHSALASTPVLLISGIVNDEVNRQAISCRANGERTQPIEGGALKERVKELLAKLAEPDAQDAAPSPAAESAELAVPDSETLGSWTPQAQTPQSKAYRITEEQLQSFKQAAARIKELEAAVEEERGKAARLTEQLQQANSRNSGTSGDNRVAQLEVALREAQQRVEELAEQAVKVNKLERRNQELEAVVSELQSNAPAMEPEYEAGNGHHPGIAELQALLTDQQQRLADLAHELVQHGDSGERVQALQRSLTEEQTRANEHATRCLDLEQALSRANARVGELTELLAKINRLAMGPEDALRIS